MLGLELVFRLPVGNAELVEVLGLVERPVVWSGLELSRYATDMVDGLMSASPTSTSRTATHNVDHEEHSSCVQRVREVEEVLRCAKFVVQLCALASSRAEHEPNMFDAQ